MLTFTLHYARIILMCCLGVVCYLPLSATSLNGTYLIDATITTGTDSTFGNFASAIAYLTGGGSRTDGGPANTAPFGVSGPVVFTVADGVYNEQVNLVGSIPGTTPVNTIRFTGVNVNNAILQYAGASNSRHTIKLENTHYVRFDNLTIQTTGTAYGYGVFITGTSSAIQVKKCVIDLQGGAPTSTSSTGTDYIGILLYASSTPSTISSTGGTSCDSLEIDSNMIVNASFGLALVGNSATPSTEVLVRNNKLVNVWYTGITVQQATNLELRNNEVELAIGTRSASQKRNIGYGITLSTISAVSPKTLQVTGNKVINPVSVGFALYLVSNPAGTRGLFANNMIGGGFQDQLNDQFTGVVFGGVERWLIANNTVSVDHLGANTSPQYAMRIAGNGTTLSSGITLYNNILSCTNGNAPQGVLLVENTASIDSMDYNHFYMSENPAGLVLSLNNASYTRTDFIGAQGFNAHSVFEPVLFVNDTNLHIQTRCNQGVALAGITTDIDGDVRNNPPAMGADEGSALNNNIQMLGILNPVTPFTAGSQPIRLVVRNTGANAVTSFVAAYRLNNGAEFSTTWNGTLNPCDTVTVTFNSVLFGTGRSNLLVYTRQPNGAADARMENDTLTQAFIPVLPGGAYTIDQSQPTGGSNFHSFTDAVLALDGGITGPVVFTVAAGIYTEQVTINKVAGVSATNTITFDGGAGNASTRILSFNSTSSTNTHTLMIASPQISIRNLTIEAGGTYAWVVRLNSGADYTQVKHCILRVTSPDAATSGSSNYACLVVSHLSSNFQVGCKVDYLEIDSNAFYYGLFSFVHRGGVGNATGAGYSALASVNNQVRWNYMYSPSGPGVLIGNQDNAKVIGNSIIATRPTTSWDTDPAAINVVGCTSTGSNRTEIIGNKMYNIGKGIEVQWSSNPVTSKGLIANNMIGGIYVKNTSSGIEFSNTPNTANWNVFHNTVNLNPTGSNNISYAAIGVLSATSTGISIYNNILAHTAPGLGLPLYVADKACIDSMDYNQFYKADLQPNGIAYIGRNIPSDSVAGAEGFNLHSVVLAPSFVNDTTLHLTDGCVTGLPIAEITTDIDGQVRSLPPTVGADEIITAKKQHDVALVNVVSPGVVAYTSTPDLIVRLKNAGSTMLTSANITYQLNNDPPVSQLWVGTLQSCDTASFHLGSLNLGLGSNVLRIYSSAPNNQADSVNTNDTIVYNFMNSTPLSGTYTLGGASANYPDFASAVSHLLTYGISGNVTFLVNPGTYTGRVDINGAIPGTSDTSEVIFDGVDAATRTISFSGNGATIYLNSASHVTFRNLTITASTVNVNSYGIWGVNASYLKVKHCIISMGGAATTATATSIAGIVLNGSASASSPTTGGVAHGVEIDSNQINYGYYGILHMGLNNSNSTGGKFRNNIINNSYAYGIYTRYHIGITISNNTIAMRGDNASATGIHLQNTSALTDTNAIVANVISRFGSRGIYLTTSVGGINSSKGLIANNVIAGGLQVSDAAYGIYLNGGFWNVFHNSINMTKTFSAAGAAAMGLGSVSNVSVVNNIFACTGGGAGVPFYCNTATAVDTMDYNLFVHPDAWNGATLKYLGAPFTISDFAGGAGFDNNSIGTLRSPFVNDSNLHVSSVCSKGVAVRGVPVDADQVLRATPPGIGAYEGSSLVNEISLVNVLLPQPLVNGLNEIRAVVKNTGSNAITAYSVGYRLNNGSVVDISQASLIQPCAYDTLTFTGADRMNLGSMSTYDLSVFTFNPNNVADANPANDSMNLVIGVPLSGVYTLGGAGADFGTFTEAADAMKIRGISGAVTFNVAPGLRFTEKPVVLEKISGNPQFPVTFRKNGTGANPVVYGIDGTGSYDAVFTLKGTDRVTFDGIDVADSVINQNATTRMDAGYMLVNADGEDGAGNNTIKNSKITLNKLNTASYGILQASYGLGGATIPTSTNGANHSNAYINLQINNCGYGVYVSGYPVFPDSNTLITATGQDSFVVGSDNPDNNIATGGIALFYQSGAEISNARVHHVAGTGTVVSGIYLSNTMPVSARCVIRNNYVYSISTTSTSTSAAGGVNGIRVDVNGSVGAVVMNNVITDLRKANISTPNALPFIRGIAHGAGSVGDADYSHNAVSVSSGSSLNVSSAAFWRASGGVTTLKNNILLNTTGNQSGLATHYVFYDPAYGILSQNNLLWSSNNNSSISATIADFAAWKQASGDQYSINALPVFEAANLLKPLETDSTCWYVNGRGVHVDTTVQVIDIAGNARPLQPADGVPDIGAYEVTPLTIPPLATAVPDSIAPYQLTDTLQYFMLGGDTVARVKWPAFSDIPKVTMRQYTGTRPVSVNSTDNYMYFYTDMQASSAMFYPYRLDLYYQEAWTGTNPAEADIRLAQLDQNSQAWTAANPGFSEIDTVRNILTTDYLLVFTAYSGTDQYNPMPVSLTSFNGVKSGRQVNLFWRTSSETNNKGFEVQRSADGVHFEKAGFVNGKGNYHLTSDYRFTDAYAFAANPAVLYYRLKQVDYSETVTYSPTIVIANAGSENGTGKLAAYPNPFSTGVNIELTSEGSASRAELEVSDISGRVVQTGAILLKQGMHTYYLDSFNNLEKGVYVIKVQTEGKVQVTKVIKQ